MAPKDLFKLSNQELMCIEHHLQQEQLLVKKFRHLAHENDEHQIKNLYTSLADNHQSHYDKLFDYLQGNLDHLH